MSNIAVTVSGDSTAHEKIMYGVINLMLKAKSYGNPTQSDVQKLCFASLCLAASHTSEAQLENLDNVLEELSGIYNTLAVQNDSK